MILMVVMMMMMVVVVVVAVMMSYKRVVCEEDLFDGVESSFTIMQRLMVVVDDVSDPRLVDVVEPLRPEREEREVAIGHVAVLGAKQKPRLDRPLRVTEHDHCGAQHATRVPVCGVYHHYNNKISIAPTICFIVYYIVIFYRLSLLAHISISISVVITAV